MFARTGWSKIGLTETNVSGGSSLFWASISYGKRRNFISEHPAEDNDRRASQSGQPNMHCEAIDEANSNHSL